MKKILLTVLVFLLFSVSCTENQRAKEWGGNATYVVPDNYKVVNVTWKDSDLWILVKPMSKKDSAEIYIFFEKSGWGIMNGQYKLIENKTK